MKALWTDEETDEVMKTTYEYVTDLHNCLEKVGQLARKNLTITKTDKLSQKTKPHQLKVNDKV